MTKRQRQRDILLYAFADFLMAMAAWVVFFMYRKNVEGFDWKWETLLQDQNFYFGVLVIPTGWALFYSIFDEYRDLYRMSRLSVLTKTFFLTFLGVTFLFFTLILDDFVKGYRTYYKSFFALFACHFLLTVTMRMILLTRASRRLKSGLVTYKTLIVGGNANALELYEDIAQRKKALGNNFVGFIDTNGQSSNELAMYLTKLGKIENLENVIRQHAIEEVIIAIETSEHNRLRDILNILFDFDDKILIKIIPDMYDIMLGTVKMNHLYGAVLIEIKQEMMPHWQRLFKRLVDVIASLLFLLLLSPLYAFIIFRVKLSSSGPIFFVQERIGLNGRPFKIFKFRSMYVGAEQLGPQLSRDGDNRCTPWGATMRKWRFDELPQFWNVLIGDMSLVGPRPERQYYIEQIMARAPHYKHLLKVRPGITSWGQVKYGYASSVEEMLQRLKFDILYIENRSLALDFKIMFYTILVLTQGKGK